MKFLILPILIFVINIGYSQKNTNKYVKAQEAIEEIDDLPDATLIKNQVERVYDIYSKILGEEKYNSRTINETKLIERRKEIQKYYREWKKSIDKALELNIKLKTDFSTIEKKEKYSNQERQLLENIYEDALNAKEAVDKSEARLVDKATKYLKKDIGGFKKHRRTTIFIRSVQYADNHKDLINDLKSLENEIEKYQNELNNKRKELNKTSINFKKYETEILKSKQEKDATLEALKHNRTKYNRILNAKELALLELNKLKEMIDSLENKQNHKENLIVFQKKQILTQDSLIQLKIDSLHSFALELDNFKNALQAKQDSLDVVSKELVTKEKTLKTVETEKESANFWFYSIIWIVIILLVIITSIYRKNRQRKQQNKLLGNLMRELNHRVKNNLQTVASLLNIQSRKTNSDETKTVLNEAKNRILSMALIHKKLHQNKEDAAVTVDLVPYIKDLVSDMLRFYGHENEIFTLNNKTESNDIPIELDQASSLGLIINELISNSFKHGLSHNAAPILQIDLEQKEERLNLRVKDNGRGLPKNVDLNTNKTFGLHMISILIKEIKGKLNYKNDNGACFDLIIPYSLN